MPPFEWFMAKVEHKTFHYPIVSILEKSRLFEAIIQF